MTIQRGGVSIEVITMPETRIEVRLEDGRSCWFGDTMFTRHELPISDEEAEKLISLTRKAHAVAASAAPAKPKGIEP